MAEEEALRKEQLEDSILAGSLDPTVEQHSDDLQKAGVPHVVAASRPEKSSSSSVTIR